MPTTVSRTAIPAEKLKELAILGQLQPDDLVWTTGLGQWAEARQISWLSTAIATPPAISTTPEPRQAYDIGITLRTRTCTLAYVSLTLVCLSLITGGILLLPGLVCGHIALAQCHRDPNMTGKGFAVAALVVAYVIVVVLVLILLGILGLFMGAG